MFRRLRWLTILLPAVAVDLLELVSDTALDQVLPFPWDTLLVVAIVMMLAFVFSSFAFRSIDRLTNELAQRNAEMPPSGRSTG